MNETITLLLDIQSPNCGIDAEAFILERVTIA